VQLANDGAALSDLGLRDAVLGAVLGRDRIEALILGICT
jgi:hypothetical protein